MNRVRFWAMMTALCLLVLPAVCTAAEKLTKEDLVFHFEEIAYSLGDEAQPLVKAIEVIDIPMDILEMESCLFTGMDREFSNEEIVLGTYPIGPNGTDQLETIMIIGGSHQTPRGIGIGSSKEEVISAYGSEFIFDYDQMTYPIGNPLTEPVLVFILDLETDCVSGYYMMRNSA